MKKTVPANDIEGNKLGGMKDAHNVESLAIGN